MTKVQRGAMLRSAPLADKFRVFAGTAAIAPAALAAQHTAVLSVSIQNDMSSPENLFVGNQFGQYREIGPGGVQELMVLDLSLIYVRSAAGTATYNVIAGE